MKYYCKTLGKKKLKQICMHLYGIKKSAASRICFTDYTVIIPIKTVTSFLLCLSKKASKVRSCQLCDVQCSIDGGRNIADNYTVKLVKKQNKTMKTSVTDPWRNGANPSSDSHEEGFKNARFEDSFVSENTDPSRLFDSEQYLARLYSRLKHVKGGSSKKDLVNSLSEAKADCIARLVTNNRRFETKEEALLAANPVIRHIAPHLQALTAGELVHLLKADVLQSVTDEQNGHQDRMNMETDTVAEELPIKAGQSESEETSTRPVKIYNANRDGSEPNRID